MNPIARAKLIKLVGQFGWGILDNHKQCEGLLRDIYGDQYRREFFVLMAVVKDQIAAELVSASCEVPFEVLLGRLAIRLEENNGFKPDLARWGVESWAFALGVPGGSKTVIPKPARSRPGEAKSPTPKPAIDFSACTFAGRKVSNVKELAVALTKDWHGGLKDFGQGKVLDWVKAVAKDLDLGARLAVIHEDTRLTPDEKLTVALVEMAPTLPVVWKGRFVDQWWAAQEPEVFKELLGSVIRPRLEGCPGWPRELARKVSRLGAAGLSKHHLEALERVVIKGDHSLWLDRREVTSTTLPMDPDVAIELLESRLPSLIEEHTGNGWLRESADRLRKYWPQVQALNCGARKVDVLPWLLMEPKALERSARALSVKYVGSKDRALDRVWNTSGGWGTAVQAVLCAADRRKFVMAGQVENPVPSPPPQRYTNTLGHVLVRVPGIQVLFSVWDVRVRDYMLYAAATVGTDRGWMAPGYAQGDDHPVAKVSWEDAQSFCAWLTRKERGMGVIGAGQNYRLPTDAEWSVAVGLEGEFGGSPKDKDGKIKGVYPWGRQWPPPKGAGNYAPNLGVDNYDHTSPVGSFKPNKHGLYDMGGNVWQWCEDWHDGQQKARVLRGSSWDGINPGVLLSSCRDGYSPESRYYSIGFRFVLDGAFSR